MKRTIMILILCLAIPAFPQAVKIISPNGGESFYAGQEVTISWTKRNQSEMGNLLFSDDNGLTWNFIAETDKSAFQWIVPHLKKGTDQGLIKVIEPDVSFPEAWTDASDGNFTIKASPPDAYEPNDDFASARSISIGDSVVKHAIVMGDDSAGFDDDYYKVTMTGGKFTTVSIFEYRNQLSFPIIQLYDASGRLVAEGGSVLEFNILQSGIYYLKISYDREVYKFVQWYEYGISIRQSSGPSITLSSPNGGEIFSAEQKVKVTWQADFTQSAIGIQYSIDSGKSWRNAWYDSITPWSSTSYSWRVPHLKHRTDRALIKVFARDSTIPAFDVSNGPFTILASPNDAYELNNNFASAKTVSVGDSAVKNAIVMKSYAYNDSTGIDTSLTDNDFFKVSLRAGKVATISVVDLVYYYTGNIFEDMSMGPVFIRLFDASKNQIGMGYQSLSSYIPQAGFYYFQISAGEGTDYWNKYSLLIRQSDPITLISPSGGENFRAGEKVTIRWTADPSFGYIELLYSLNNGTSWNTWNTVSEGVDSVFWVVPALKARTDQALFKIKVSASDETAGQFDVSNGPFTIQEAPLDAYEPNNNMSSAYPIAVGDSVIKNAVTYWYAESYGDTTGITGSPGDSDYYKVNLTAGSLIKISDWSYDSLDVAPNVELFDSSQRVFPIPGSYSINSDCYNIRQSGVYYVRICSGWTKYGLSINPITTLLAQESVLDIDAMQVDSNLQVYRSRLIADTTKLTIDFTLDRKYASNVTTMVLAPMDLASLPDEKAKVKAIAVFYSGSMNTADIVIPYGHSDLNGYPEKALAVAHQNFWTGDPWKSVSYSIDTIKNQIVVHVESLRADLFQVYVKADPSSALNFAKPPQVLGIRANFLSQKQSIAVHFSLPKAANADLRLYNVQGKCVRKSMLAVEAGFTTMMWNLGGLANGKYFLTMKAGNYYSKEAILIMK